jgi:hypothetical protein
MFNKSIPHMHRETHPFLKETVWDSARVPMAPREIMEGTALRKCIVIVIKI